MRAVIKGSMQEGNAEIVFYGTYKECIHYMRNNKGWDDLMSFREDGNLGRYASWVL